MSTHHVDADNSKRDLDKLVEPEREDSFTTSNGHVAAVSDNLEVTKIPHKDQWKSLEGYSPLLDAATSRGVESPTLRQRRDTPDISFSSLGGLT
jgi:hypothetical protein